MKKLMPYDKRYIDKSDLDSVVYALKQDKITTGPSVFKFEKKFVLYKAKYASVCNSGTSALYLAFKAINLKKDDIVIMPSITFVSSYSVSKILNARFT